MDNFVIYKSDDNGETFEEIRNDTEGYADICKLANGGLGLAYFAEVKDEETGDTTNTIYYQEANGDDLSDKDSWKEFEHGVEDSSPYTKRKVVVDDEDIEECAPSVVQLPSGRLLVAYVRTIDEESILGYKSSDDGGETWGDKTKENEGFIKIATVT